MAIAIESQSTDYVTGTADQTLVFAAPTGITDDDLLIAVITKQTLTNVTQPDGWKALRDNTTDYVACFYKIASSESHSYSFTLSRAHNYAHGIIFRISGAGEPDADAYAHSNTWDTDVDCPNITTSENDSLVLWVGYIASISSTALVLSSTRGSEEYNSYANSNAHSLFVYSEDIATAGAQAGATLTLSSGNNWDGGYAVSIPPASGGDPATGFLTLTAGGQHLIFSQ